MSAWRRRRRSRWSGRGARSGGRSAGRRHRSDWSAWRSGLGVRRYGARGSGRTGCRGSRSGGIRWRTCTPLPRGESRRARCRLIGAKHVDRVPGHHTARSGVRRADNGARRAMARERHFVKDPRAVDDAERHRLTTPKYCEGATRWEKDGGRDEVVEEARVDEHPRAECAPGVEIEDLIVRSQWAPADEAGRCPEADPRWRPDIARHPCPAIRKEDPTSVVKDGPGVGRIAHEGPTLRGIHPAPARIRAEPLLVRVPDPAVGRIVGPLPVGRQSVLELREHFVP